MVVEDKRKRFLTKYNLLSVGSHFEFAENVFIKTEEFSFGEWSAEKTYNAIGVTGEMSGRFEHFNDTQELFVVNAKIVIED